MITSAILHLFLGFIPVVSAPVEAISALANIGSWVVTMNYYIPIGTFLSALAVYLAFWLVCAVISAVLQLL